MKRKFSLLTAALACSLVFFMASPAGATAVQDFFWIDFDETTPLYGSGGTWWPGTELGVWFEYTFDSPYNDWSSTIWNQWFYDHPTVYDYYKMIEYEVVFVPHSVDAYAEVWINWSTPQWSPNDDNPPLPGADAFIERELLWIYDWDETPGTTFRPGIGLYAIYDYNPEWISIDIIGNDVYVQGTILHECLPQPQDQVPLPAAGLLFGSGLLGIAGLKRKFLG